MTHPSNNSVKGNIIFACGACSDEMNGVFGLHAHIRKYGCRLESKPTDKKELRERLKQILSGNIHCGYYHDPNGTCYNQECRDNGPCSIDCPGSDNVIDQIMQLIEEESKIGTLEG